MADFIDASNKFWSAIVSKMQHTGRKNEIVNLRSRTPAFIGGEFSSAEENRTTYQKASFQ